MRTATVFLAAALSLTAGLASAADLPTHKAPAAAPLAPAWNWTGLYAGLNAGFVVSATDFWHNRLNGNALIASGSSKSSPQFRGGGQIGYRYQFPSGLVLGGFGYLTTGPNKSSSSAAVDSGTSNLLNGRVEAQAGYAFGSLLPYAMAGWTVASFDTTRTQKLGLGAPPAFTDTASAVAYGPSVGAGVDWRVYGNWIVFAQYRYTWERFNHEVFPTAGFYQNERSRIQSGLFGVNYKFWRPSGSCDDPGRSGFRRPLGTLLTLRRPVAANCCKK